MVEAQPGRPPGAHSAADQATDTSLWPHTLVVTLTRPSTISQLLVDDPSKRAIYTDAHSSGMIPRWRDMAAIIATKLALIEAPPPESLAAASPNLFSGVDWAKISAGTLTMHLIDMIAFADAWAAIERRWAADGDYSVRTRAYRCSPLPGLVSLAPWLTAGLAGCHTTGDAADHPQP